MNTLRIVAPSLVHLLHIVARGAGQVALLLLEHVLPLHLSSISRVQGSTIPFNIIRLFVTGNDYHLRLNACKLAQVIFVLISAFPPPRSSSYPRKDFYSLIYRVTYARAVGCARPWAWA